MRVPCQTGREAQSQAEANGLMLFGTKTPRRTIQIRPSGVSVDMFSDHLHLMINRTLG